MKSTFLILLLSGMVLTCALGQGRYESGYRHVQLYADNGVDRAIPLSEVSRKHTYALIIANQQYFSATIPEVRNALNDGDVMYAYCKKLLGIPEENISYTRGATLGNFQSQLKKFSLMARIDPKAEFIVYFAGHGMPDFSDHGKPYLLPVDFDPSVYETGMPLQVFIEKITAERPQKTTIFIDACFSGNNVPVLLARNRSVVVRPGPAWLPDNVVVFHAASKDQTSVDYPQMRHGLFTYFLLKCLKDNRGRVNYADLYQYLKSEVGRTSIRVDAYQEPVVQFADNIASEWESWRF